MFLLDAFKLLNILFLSLKIIHNLKNTIFHFLYHVVGYTQFLGITKTLNYTFSSKEPLPLHLERSNVLWIVTFFISLPLALSSGTTVTVWSLWPFSFHQPKTSCKWLLLFSLNHSVINFSRHPSVLLMDTLWKFAQDLCYLNADPDELYKQMYPK